VLDADQLRRLAASILRVVSGDDAPGGGVGVDAAGAGDVRIRDSWPYGGIYVLGVRIFCGDGKCLC
jgi:hypothetical protein